MGAVSPTRAGDDAGKKKGDRRRKVEDGPIEEGPIEEGPVLVVGEEERGPSRIYLGGRRGRASSSRGSSSRAVPERSP